MGADAAVPTALVIGVEQETESRIEQRGSREHAGTSTNCSKNQVVCARCHFAGLASGIDCTHWSSSVRSAARASVSDLAERTENRRRGFVGDGNAFVSSAAA